MAFVGIFTGLAIIVIMISFVTFALIQGPRGAVDAGFFLQILTVIVIPIGVAVLAGLRHFRNHRTH